MMTMSRNEAVAAIRRKLLDLVDDDHSMCQVAGERGIYCQGFHKLTDEQLHQRHAWLQRRDPSMGRQELEDLANRWQIARQIVRKAPIACDVQALEKDTCEGWDGFDDPTIARFYKELIGEEIEVASSPS